MTLTVFFHAGGLTVMRDFCQLKNKQVMQFVNQDLGTRSGLSLPISCSIEECSFVIWNDLSWIWGRDHPFWRVCWWVPGVVDAEYRQVWGGGILLYFLFLWLKGRLKKEKANTEKEVNSGLIFLYSKNRTSLTAFFGFLKKQKTAYLMVLACKRINKVFKPCIATVQYLFIKVLESLLFYLWVVSLKGFVQLVSKSWVYRFPV